VITTYSLDEIVAAGNAPSVRWLQKEIRARRITAHKIGRHWRMTDRDIDQMLDARRNTTQPPTAVAPLRESNHLGLSPTSLRRLRTGKAGAAA
jgi:hypothetical protein